MFRHKLLILYTSHVVISAFSVESNEFRNVPETSFNTSLQNKVIVLRLELHKSPHYGWMNSWNYCCNETIQVRSIRQWKFVREFAEKFNKQLSNTLMQLLQWTSEHKQQRWLLSADWCIQLVHVIQQFGLCNFAFADWSNSSRECKQNIHVDFASFFSLFYFRLILKLREGFSMKR